MALHHAMAGFSHGRSMIGYVCGVIIGAVP